MYTNADLSAFCSQHHQFKDLQLVDLEKLLKPQKSQTKQVIIDIAILTSKTIEDKGYSY